MVNFAFFWTGFQNLEMPYYLQLYLIGFIWWRMGTITLRVFDTNWGMGTERQLLLKNLAGKLSRFKDGEPLFWHCKVWRPHVH